MRKHNKDRRPAGSTHVVFEKAAIIYNFYKLWRKLLVISAGLGQAPREEIRALLAERGRTIVTLMPARMNVMATKRALVGHAF